MTIPDWLLIKTIEKSILRKLLPEEIYGFKRVTFFDGDILREVRVPQVSIKWLHKNNSCK